MSATELLTKVPIFAAVSREDLALLAAHSHEQAVDAGELVSREGGPPGGMFVVIEGEFEVTRKSGEQELVLDVCGPGEVLGEMSMLEQAPRSASVRARRAGRLLVVGQDAYLSLLEASSSATLAILRTVAARLRNTEAVLRQDEALASLGRIAAGLAHELGNPTAAVMRSADRLGERLADWAAAASAVRRLALDEAQGRALDDAVAPRPLLDDDTMARADREHALEQALGRRGVARAWELAPSLAAAGWDVAALEALAAALPPAALAPALTWIATAAVLRAMTAELLEGARRMSSIIGAVKAYSYLGLAPVQEIDVNAGLESTLVMLNHCFRGVTLRRELAADLPRVEGYGSELNQVWTNLIDNALHAMAGAGELVVRTAAEGDHVAVTITDDGPGIPPEIQARLFQAFVTTKPPGTGSGLGLHLSYNVVVHKHRGRIELESRPGRTCARVTLPRRLGVT